MADIGTDLASLDAQIGDLEATIGSAQTVSAAFKSELMAMQATMSAAGQQVDGCRVRLVMDCGGRLTGWFLTVCACRMR